MYCHYNTLKFGQDTDDQKLPWWTVWSESHNGVSLPSFKRFYLKLGHLFLKEKERL